MTEEATVIDPPANEKPKTPKPGKPLPTARIAFAKQLDILRAYAVAYAATGKPVTNVEIGNIVKMSPSTVPHATGFFGDSEIGLLIRGDGGTGYIPNGAVIAFNRAHAWNPETSAHKLAPAFQQMWFAQALMPRLAFRAMEEKEAVAVLAETSGATPEYESQLVLILAYLEAAGLIAREGGQVRATRTAVEPPQPVAPQVVPETLVTPTRGVETAFARPTNGGGVHFQVTIDVDMNEMGSWTPDRISAFFAGFAQVLAAKGALEKNAARD